MSTRSKLRHGLIVGLIAYAAVAAFYCLLDVLAARSALFTVDMLGKAVFRGLRDPAVLLFPLQLDPSAILWYNGAHLAVALCIGLLATTLVGYANQHPRRASLVMSALVVVGVLTIAMVASLTEPMRSVLPWSSVVVANTIAAALAGMSLILQARGRSHAVSAAPSVS